MECGTGVALGPGLLSLVGFVMGVMWIDTIAGEVVGVLSFLAGACVHSACYTLPQIVVASLRTRLLSALGWHMFWAGWHMSKSSALPPCLSAVLWHDGPSAFPCHGRVNTDEQA